MNSKRFFFTFFIALTGAVVGVFAYSYFIGPSTKIINVPTQSVSHLASMQSSGLQLPDLTIAAEKSVHAVVHVKVVSTQQVATMNDPFYDFFFGPRGYQQKPQQQMGFGSGVIISEDGYIITNNHVINKADEIEIVLNDRRSFKGKLIGSDPATDIALVKIDAKDLPFLNYGNSDNLKVGEWVLAVGNPFNLTSTVTAGIVSAKSRSINILGGNGNLGVEAFIQTDAAVNPGNSGGALVNVNGDLVGINTAIASETGSYTGYSFAVPVSIVGKVISDIREFGVVQRALLGVTIRDIDKALAEEKNIKQIEGVYVEGVGETSGAKAAGITAGDVIISINGENVKSVPQLQEKIGRHRPGDKVKVLIKRGNDEKLFNVELRNSEGSTSVVKVDDVSSILGAVLKELDDKEKAKFQISSGLKVESLKAGKLQASGVKPGFIIVKANRVPINSAEDFKRVVATSDDGLFLAGIYPDGRVEYYAINLKD